MCQRLRKGGKARKGEKVAVVVVERVTKADMSWVKDETRLNKYRGVAPRRGGVTGTVYT